MPKKADKEKFTNIAKLIWATAEAERIRAEGHLDALEYFHSTAENLQAAIDGETFNYTTMYPSMVKPVQSEGDQLHG